MVRATAIYNDGRNNYQVNYSGTFDQAQKSFNDDMAKRKAVWGKLFKASNGEFLSSYSSASSN